MYGEGEEARPTYGYAPGIIFEIEDQISMLTVAAMPMARICNIQSDVDIGCELMIKLIAHVDSCNLLSLLLGCLDSGLGRQTPPNPTHDPSYVLPCF